MILIGFTSARPAEAQVAGRPYVGASLGQFGVSADIADGWSPALGALVGIGVRPWLDVEADFVVPGRSVTRTYGGDTVSLSFAAPGSSQEEIERLGVWTLFHNERRVSATVAGVAVFHRPIARLPRVHLGLVAGLNAQRVTDRRDYTTVRIGAGVDPNAAALGPRSETLTRTLGGLTVGVNLSFAVNSHFSIVPDLRYHYGSIGDEINDAIHGSLRAIWRL
jgi:hypothetical protein